jgi:MSHA biogenesis protein MshM
MLLWALNNKEGFIKVSGEVGTGKTLLCRKLLNSLNDPFVTVYLPNPHFSPETLYCLICDELEAALTKVNADKSQPNENVENIGQLSTTDQHVLALGKIQKALLSLASLDKQVVLVIDEAQSMPEETIEALRLLTNLETESEKLMQVVLFGQPELDVMLSSNSLRQLQQRITFQHEIRPLDREGIEQYISHRMIQAGYSGGRLFEAKAISLLVTASKGIPRLVNILCHKALMGAYGEGVNLVTAKHMKAAVKDTESAYKPWWRSVSLPGAFS